jgi:hypothetical protein
MGLPTVAIAQNNKKTLSANGDFRNFLLVLNFILAARQMRYDLYHFDLAPPILFGLAEVWIVDFVSAL